jgi:Carboxypeptidase regulatory-like domain
VNRNPLVETQKIRNSPLHILSRRIWTPILLAMVFLSSPFLQGQSTYGSVGGFVTDPSGAALVDALVMLTNLGTSEKRTQSTVADGLYSFVTVIPGQYRVEVEKQGFKRITREPVEVQVQQSTHIDIAMKVGMVSEVMTVTAATPLLQSETSSLGQVVEQRKANELPLNGRNIFNLVAVSPGVVPQGQSNDTPVGKNIFAWANYQIGGSFANQSAEYLDGQPLNIAYINLPLIVPTQDSVQEFKVQTNALGPEWGKFSGGVINLSTKSGTNLFHGEVHEYLRNKVFNSNEYFRKASQILGGTKNEPPPFTQNQFGASAGGRLIKDKTFWFFSWESFRLRQGQVFTTNVPTAAERNGDFTGLSDQAGNLITIYDPATTDPNTGVRQEFPTHNVIPLSEQDSTARALLNLFPQPTGPGIYNNYIVATSVGGNQNQVVLRIDQNVTANQRLFFRFSYWNLLNLAADPLGTGLCADHCRETVHTKAGVLDYNVNFSPTTIGDFNFNVSRFGYDRSPKNAGFDLTTVGWPASFNDVVPDNMRTPPTPCIEDMTTNIGCSQGQSFILDRNTQWNFSPSISMIRGRHTLIFGGQIEVGRDAYAQTNIASGLFAFDHTYTSSAALNPASLTGFGFASFLIGFALPPFAFFGQPSGLAQVPAVTAGQQIYRGVYFDDTWHATSKLTLNLGLRYEQQGPWSERFDRLSYFDPNAVNLASQASGRSDKGEIFLVKTGRNDSRNNMPLDKTNFAPRIGVAYSINSQTVIRSGYGIFWIPNFVSFNVNPSNDTVALGTSAYTGSSDGGVTFINKISNPFPATGIVPPPGRDFPPGQSVQTFTAGTGVFANNYFDHPAGYVQQWNLDLQRELLAGFFVDVAYAGSKGTHLPAFATQVDQMPDQYFAQAAAGTLDLFQQVPNPFTAMIGNGTTLGGATVNSGQLLLPYPQYNGLNFNGQGIYDSIYHSLQVSVQKRFAGGGTLLVAYTNAKLISNTDTITSWLESGSGFTGGIQDNYNLRAERSLSSQDVPQRLVVSYVLDLPFGRGKKFLSGVNGLAGKIVSGWGVDGITTLQRGFPLKFFTFNPTLLFNAGARPNRVPGCKAERSGSAESRLNEWFNTSCFSQPDAFTFGNEPRVDSSLRLQGIVNFDFAVFKRTTFGPAERMGLEFRAEFFNLFNHPQFGTPDTFLPDGTFGSINNTVNNPRLVQFALKFVF